MVEAPRFNVKNDQGSYLVKLTLKEAEKGGEDPTIFIEIEDQETFETFTKNVKKDDVKDS